MMEIEGALVSNAPAYSCGVVAVGALDAPTRGAMWALYDASYEATSRARFDADLARKHEAMLLYAGDTLVGFTTLELYATAWRAAPLRVLFSGDTVVDRRHWGQQALSFEWVRHLGRLKRRWPDERLVWFLLVKGHRTYRYLPVFARTFFPSELATDPELAELAAFLAQERFPDAYNASTGLVEFEPSRGQLRADYAEPRDDERTRPGVAYFLQRNPGYRRGHELVCVCDIDERNMKPMTLRLFKQGQRD